MVWLTNQRHLALFPAGTVVIDTHYRESLTCQEQDFEPAQNQFIKVIKHLSLQVRKLISVL